MFCWCGDCTVWLACDTDKCYGYRYRDRYRYRYHYRNAIKMALMQIRATIQ